MNFENFVAELRAAAQDATLTHFVQSLCRFTVEVFENGRLMTDVLAHLESDFSDADVLTIHSEMRILTRHELVDAMQVHVAADEKSAQIEMLASDLFVHYDLLLKCSGPKTALLNAVRAIADDAASSRDDSDRRSDGPTAWRDTLVKALADEFRITIGEKK